MLSWILLWFAVILLFGCSAVVPLLEDGAAEVLEERGGGEELKVHVLHDLQDDLRNEIARILGSEWTKYQPEVEAALEKLIVSTINKVKSRSQTEG